MLTVAVCLGSSCYVRGSDRIVERFEQLAHEAGLDGDIEIVGSLCMDACSLGVSVRVGDTVFHGLQPEAADSFFREEIEPAAKAGD